MKMSLRFDRIHPLRASGAPLVPHALRRRASARFRAWCNADAPTPFLARMSMAVAVAPLMGLYAAGAASGAPTPRCAIIIRQLHGNYTGARP